MCVSVCDHAVLFIISIGTGSAVFHLSSTLASYANVWAFKYDEKKTNWTNNFGRLWSKASPPPTTIQYDTQHVRRNQISRFIHKNVKESTWVETIDKYQTLIYARLIIILFELHFYKKNVVRKSTAQSAPRPQQQQQFLWFVTRRPPWPIDTC